tara:strand:- start:255 stop:533 length:279 start_codon:yes stop_codon:yes gene_type:complete
MIKENFTSVKELSKTIGTHSYKEIIKTARRMDDVYAHPTHRRELGISKGIHLVYDEKDRHVDTAYHNSFIINILKYLKGIELDITDVGDTIR